MLKRHHHTRREGQGQAIVIGAGVAGLMAALTLARSGHAVTLVERSDQTGGKISTVTLNSSEENPIDCGPTVFTMKPLFEALYQSIGLDFDREVDAIPLDQLGRHIWDKQSFEGPSWLDLYCDTERSADAIGRFSGLSDARAFHQLAKDAKRVFEDLDQSFMQAPGPSLLRIAQGARLGGLDLLMRAKPFSSLWSSLCARFKDKRLAQLFARYSTYCGGNPLFTSATLMLVIHAELSGVWRLKGGMRALTEAMTHRALDAGVYIRTGLDVTEIIVENGRACGINTLNDEALFADQILMAGDVSALQGMLSGAARRKTPAAVPPSKRGLSAVTVAMEAQTTAPFAYHTVAFSDDYPKEMADLMTGAVPNDPTLYLCASDRTSSEDTENPRTKGIERLFLIANAPADGDTRQFNDKEKTQWMNAILKKLDRSNLGLELAGTPVMTTPSDFARRYPGSGGSLYGRAPHGPLASFQRPGVKTRLAGLYLAGGTVHPSAGVPMAALSGHTAAKQMMADWASTNRHHRAAMPGGM